jgi:trigger factor
MTLTIDRPTACRVVLTATTASDTVTEERQKVVTSVARSARIDGFRRGKAPRSLVEQRFAVEIREELEERLIRRAWDEGREREDLRPVGPLSVKDSRWEDDGSFFVEGEFEVYPTVNIPSLEGFTPSEFDVAPTEDEVEQALEQLRQRQAQWQSVEGEKVAEGLLVEAAVAGEFPEGDGEPFRRDRALFVVGKGEVVPELESAVTGREVGDVASAERILGDTDPEEVRGKRVTYTITINGLRRQVMPELDDEFASSLGVEGGLEALREQVRTRVRVEKLQLRRQVWRRALTDFLAQGEILELPRRVVQEETRREVLSFAESLAQRGVDPANPELDWDKLEGEARAQVEDRLRQELLLDAAAVSLGIDVDDAQVDAEVEKESRRSGVPFAELKGNLRKQHGLERVRGILRRSRVVDQVLAPHEQKE